MFVIIKIDDILIVNMIIFIIVLNILQIIIDLNMYVLFSLLQINHNFIYIVIHLYV